MWRRKMICIKRMNPNITRTLVHPSVPCPDGLKRCGMADVWGNYFCIRNDTNCPVQLIKFTGEKPIIDDNLTYYFSLKNEVTDIPYYMVYSYHPKYFNSTKMPVEFSVSENKPCINISRFSNTTITIFLNNDEENYGCIDKSAVNIETMRNLDFEPGVPITLMDRKYSILDNDTLNNYLSNNDLLEDSNLFFSKVKAYDNSTDIENTNISLYYRPYIGYNQKCYQDQNIDSWSVLINESKTFQFLLLVLELVNLCFLCVFVSLLALMKSHSTTLYTLILLLKILVGSTFIYLNIKLISKCYDNSNMIIQYMEDNINNKCFDIDTMYLVEMYDLVRLIRMCNQYNTLLHYGSLLYGFCFFIQLIRLIYKTAHRYNKQQKKNKKLAQDVLVEHNK
jgi:hypothetical protein